MPHSYRVLVDSLVKYTHKFHEAERGKDHAAAQFLEIKILAAADMLRLSDPPREASRDNLRVFIHRLEGTQRLLGDERYEKKIQPIVEKLQKHFVHATR
ncbi:MAG: hypothetical protein AAB581_02425 [Patescibacteria group bacterium]